MSRFSGRAPAGTRIALAGVVCALALTACGTGASSSTGTAATGSSTVAAPPPVSDDEAGRLPRFPTAPPTPVLPKAASAGQEQQFIGMVFGDAQAEWSKVFAASGVPYSAAKLVLFSSAVHTGCGTESAQVGPFYCPADRSVYLDLSFFDQMAQRYGVGGDFAQAYVVAHELGHHIQNLTGTTSRVATLRQQLPEASANSLSVLTELQADCYAGIWAYSTYRRGLLEPGDIQEALTAAAAVGDDFLQRSAGGSVSPEQWTHGSSAQRQHWLTIGYQSGEPASCNTFTPTGSGS